jgi:hypothetical protein
VVDGSEVTGNTDNPKGSDYDCSDSLFSSLNSSPSDETVPVFSETNAFSGNFIDL